MPYGYFNKSTKNLLAFYHLPQPASIKTICIRLPPRSRQTPKNPITVWRVCKTNAPIVCECMSRPKEATVFDPNSKDEPPRTYVCVFLNLTYVCVHVAQIDQRPSRSDMSTDCLIMVQAIIRPLKFERVSLFI